MPVSLCDGVYWVGAVDAGLRDFHGYETDRGTTYNAYLVRDRETALIDTVKKGFAGTLLANVAEIVPLDKVDWVVCNHAEPDHAGSLPEVMAALPNATLVCTEKCRQTLALFFDMTAWKVRIIGPGDTLPLGDRTLEFVQTPLAHWPESMFTFLPQDGVLFSMDAFGQHYGTPERFDNASDLDAVMDEAAAYYANILLPFGTPTAKAMAAAEKLPVRMIAPSHGVIWRGHLDRILAGYKAWTSGAVCNKVVVLCDTMWGATERMAEELAAGAADAGAETVLLPVRKASLTRIAREVMDAAAVAVGSPTVNGGIMPQMGAVLTHLQGLKPAPKAAVAFGAYGWAKGGAEGVQTVLEAMRWEIIAEPLRVQYRPTEDDLRRCRETGAQLAQKAAEKAGAGK